MVTGETLLKFTDYPFAYSIVGIISGIIGFSLGQNQFIFLGIAGAFGTFLTIIDPIGWLLRKNAEDRINKGYGKKMDSQNLEIKYKISALKSKSINFEIEKIIGLFYFIIIVLLFMLAIVPDTPFFENLIIKNNLGEPMCSDSCFKTGYILTSTFVLVILIAKANRFWKELDKKIPIAGFHQIAINNDNATQTSVESMTRAVEQNDWELAKVWQKKIEDEIKYKKGKREIIIKSAEAIFKPLHMESMSIDVSLSQISKTRAYGTIAIDQWQKITIESTHVMIENSQLRKEISDFYDKIEEYNQLIILVKNKTKDEILKEASSIFARDVREIQYWIIHDKDSHVAPDMLSCVLFNTHPLQTEEDSKPHQLDLQLSVKGRKIQLTIPKENLEFTKFEEFWKNIMKEIDSDEQLDKLKQLHKELTIKNFELKKKYQDMIELQWKSN